MPVCFLRSPSAAAPLFHRHLQIRGVVSHRRDDQHARLCELGAERRQIDHRVTRHCLLGLDHAQEVDVTTPVNGKRDARMKWKLRPPTLLPSSTSQADR
jgi:hypothetical protein